VYADACAVVAATADSGDGRYVAGPTERAAVSFGGSTCACADARSADCGGSEGARAGTERAVADFGRRERDASDFAGAERRGSASAGCLRAGVQDYSAAAGLFGFVVACAAGRSGDRGGIARADRARGARLSIHGTCGGATFGGGGAEEQFVAGKAGGGGCEFIRRKEGRILGAIEAGVGRK